MKKFSLVIGLCAAVGLVRADVPPIEGTNVVGFAGIAVAGNANSIVTVPFEACLQNGVPGMLADLVSTNGLTAAADAADAATADQLVVLTTNETGQVYYYYWYQAGQGWAAVTSEQLMPGGTNATINPPAATNFPVARGLGFWLKRPAGASAATLYLKGQVSSAKQATAISSGLNLVGYGNVEAFTLNDSGIDWSGVYGSSTKSSDKIWVVNADGSFTEYYYFVKPATWSTTLYDSVTNKWVTQDYAAATNVISAGQGFWYQRRGAGSFTLKPNGE